MHSAMTLGWCGLVEVRVTNHDTGEVAVDEVRNLITDVGLEYLAGTLADVEGGTGGLYEFAVGTDATAPTASDTALGNEVYRALLLSREVSGPGVCTSVAYIAPEEGNVQIEEVGWFLEDGRMVARLAYSYSKTSAESVQFTRIDNLTRA